MAQDQIHPRPHAGAVPLNWAEPYLGIPYRDLGFERAGCSCWGLVCMVYAEQRGIVLPRHDTITSAQLARMMRAFTDEFGGSPWRPIERCDVTDFDIVLLRERNLPVHVGIAVGNSRMLHVEQGTNSACVSLSHPFFRGRILGFYRYQPEI